MEALMKKLAEEQVDVAVERAIADSELQHEGPEFEQSLKHATMAELKRRGVRVQSYTNHSLRGKRGRS